MEKFEPIDIIALVIIIGCMTSMIIKQDTVFKDIVLTIVGFYFGRQSKSNPPNSKITGIIILIFLQYFI